jgi:hypothetical protein
MEIREDMATKEDLYEALGILRIAAIFLLAAVHLNAASSEFAQLVSKILTSRVDYRPEFVDKVFEETGGHPFLTVNLLITFFDWLIQKEHDSRGRQLGIAHFETFAADCLSLKYLSASSEYAFFRNAIIEALSIHGRSEEPWLHMVYRCLRQIAVRSPRELSCTRAVFAEICERLGIRSALGSGPEYLLSAAASANFFGFDDGRVWSRIKVLGRLCAAAEPRVGF